MSIGPDMFKSIIKSAHRDLVYGRRTQILAETISPLFPKLASVLDVGTGDGLIASLWQKARPDLQVSGLDVLVRDQTYIPVRPFDGQTIPCNDSSVDVVTFIDVLHHTIDPKRLIIEASRVARRCVIIKDHLAENSSDYAILRFMDWIGNAPHGVVLPYNYQSKRTWLESFAAAKLGILYFSDRIPLYRSPFNYVFGRKLHFIAQLQRI